MNYPYHTTNFMFSHVVSNVMDRFKSFNLRKKSRWHHQCNLVNVKYAKPLFEEAKFWKNVFWHLKQSHRVTTPTCACKSRVKSDAWIQWPKNLQMLLLGQSHWCQLCRMLPGKYILMLCFWQSYIFGRMFLFCCLPFLLGGGCYFAPQLMFSWLLSLSLLLPSLFLILSLLEIKGLKRMAKHAMLLRKIKFWQIIYFWEEGVVLFLHNILLVIVVVILVLAKQGAKNN